LLIICIGPPVCNEKERVDTVRGCKWVDEVVENVPYVMNDEYLTYIIEKYKIDYIVHGDDPCIVDGKNVYESAIKLGKYLTIPRTEGVSTTDIVGRMLLLSRAHHDLSKKNGTAEENSLKKLVRTLHDEETHDRKSNFLTTSRIIRLFGAGVKAPKPTDRVVYIAGGWDMFHAGHIEALEKAKK
jgi:ethanolamine-phosphate cytidylyltransferase